MWLIQNPRSPIAYAEKRRRNSRRRRARNGRRRWSRVRTGAPMLGPGSPSSSSASGDRAERRRLRQGAVRAVVAPRPAGRRVAPAVDVHEWSRSRSVRDPTRGTRSGPRSRRGHPTRAGPSRRTPRDRLGSPRRRAPRLRGSGSRPVRRRSRDPASGELERERLGEVLDRRLHRRVHTEARCGT